MGASVHLPGDPGMDLAIASQDAVGTDQAGGVEDVSRVAVVAFEKGGGLDVDAVLPCLQAIAVGVLVWYGHGQAIVQLLDGGIDRRCVAKLGKNKELDRE